jgi:hypothetical protein
VFENRVLRRISGPKRDEVTGKWRKLHNEEFHNLHLSPNIIHHQFRYNPCRVLASAPNIITLIKSRKIRWTGNVARMGEDSKVYKVLVGKLGGKRPLGRPRRIWEDGIRMDLGEIG